MADNRMFLVHRPSGIGISLGKKYGLSWFRPPDPERMEEFYEVLKRLGGVDDLILLTETDGTDWRYTGEKQHGFHVFNLPETGRVEGV